MVVYLSIFHGVLGEVFGQEIFHACAMMVSMRVRVSIRSRGDR